MVRRAQRRLQRVGFVTCPKSQMEPHRHLDFVGKIFDLNCSTLANRKGMLRDLVRQWLLLVLRLLTKKGMERMLDVGMASVGASSGGRLKPFPSGCLLLETFFFGGLPSGLLRPLLAAKCCAVVRQVFKVQPRVQSTPPVTWSG